MDNRWYVIRTKPHKEESVCSLLKGVNIETFLPKLDHYIRLRHLSYSRSEPLFPSYCFCRIDFSEARNYNLVRYTRGVLQILGVPHPVAVDDEVIDLLKERVDTGAMGKIIPFRRGDTIRVKRGILKDLVGILENPVSLEGRVCVLLNLVNHRMKTELHWNEVERVAAA